VRDMYGASEDKGLGSHDEKRLSQTWKFQRLGPEFLLLTIAAILHADRAADWQAWDPSCNNGKGFLMIGMP